MLFRDPPLHSRCVVSTVIASPDQLAPARLTDILRGAGVLPNGRVVSIHVTGNPAFNSSVSHLRVEYTPDASEDAPGALVLKCNLQEPWARVGGKDEVGFYLEARTVRLPMILSCYDAVYDRETEDSHLLLLDISDTHEPSVTRDDLIALRGVPDDDRLDACVDAIAGIHAHWWEHPSLADGMRDLSGWYGTKDRFQHIVERRSHEWKQLSATPEAELPTDLHDLYAHAVEQLPYLWDNGLGQRVASGRGRTLVHGDCFLSQFLSPRDGRGQTYLVDWQGAWVDLPTYDLTHLFATFWTPEQRREDCRERRALRRYLSALQDAGVEGYTREQLEDDYRMVLIFMIFYPVWDAVNGADRSYWWPKMSCLTSAYQDWACQELLR